ncbi:hypothetical protein SPRG_00233 [Saprolegnia parasitica CBS 223.65]|uniref:Uncharacterized protein n=1 Tax=Saprolegnia parasitica (strain CBS 223.65) TaxID=695850 RepID=A0A067CXE9_SAPPC|nr:hypothetical protein SPRG_00233 [Saprolegnia parasitica CBS 223.65]KDO35384.1 hypothetical protein SPRG_00233 [Saprolegnia parasitica CBS 223.65]|eukprot:XP_012193728.1 hypothetical protein SPRG_00233 [Saprolegnia parasitica CBS 223.65]
MRHRLRRLLVGLLALRAVIAGDPRLGRALRVVPVATTTFTTNCDGVEWGDAAYGSEAEPDQVSCVWFPNGSVYRGAVKTYSARMGTTGFIKNTLDGEFAIDYVAFLPNTAAVIELDNLNLSRVNSSLDVDIHGIPIVAKTIFWEIN